MGSKIRYRVKPDQIQPAVSSSKYDNPVSYFSIIPIPKSSILQVSPLNTIAWLVFAQTAYISFSFVLHPKPWISSKDFLLQLEIGTVGMRVLYIFKMLMNVNKIILKHFAPFKLCPNIQVKICTGMKYTSIIWV